MNVLNLNYTTNYNRPRYNKVYRLNSLPFSNVASFKAAPVPFEEMFKKEFLFMLAKEGATCAYTGRKLFPKNDFLDIKNLKELLIPIDYTLGFEYLEKCNEKLFEGKNKIYNAIKREHDKHPKYNLQEIINELYPKMIENLCKKEQKILRRAMSSNLGSDLQYKNFQHIRDFLIIRNFIIDNYYNSNKKPSTLVLSCPIEQIRGLNISDKKTFDKVCRNIGELFNIYSSAEGFIFNCKSKKLNSEDIVIQLLRTITATLDHIHPQVLQKEETLRNENKDNPFWVTILSCDAINEFKGCLEFNDFVKYCPFPVRKNLQKHIDSLIEIQKRWTNINELKKANKLADYILVLKYELERRATRLKINVDELQNSIGQKKFDKKVKNVKEWLDIEK